MKKITFILVFILCAEALNAQSFTVFDLDTTSFPVMKAKFYAFDKNYKQLLELSAEDFEVYEDGVEREVLSISCPEPVPSTAISSVLTMDVSGSMQGLMLEKAQEAARSWVNGLPLGKSECAITSFDNVNNMIQDFTKDRNRLLQKIELLGARGGTDYEAGFINPLAGGLLVAQTGKYKKVLVFLTDGRPNFTPDVSSIIAEARKYGITIFAVTLDMPCPHCLRDIADQTGGACFENVSTVEEAREIYMKIMQTSQGSGACEIEWEARYKCLLEMTEVDIKCIPLNLDDFSKYTSLFNKIAKLKFNPGGIYFINKEPGTKHDTTIVVTAINADFEVSDIISSNPDFKAAPSSFSLNVGDSLEITISNTPSDSGYSYAEFDFVNNMCETKYYAAGGFKSKKPSAQTLKLTHPNGAEVFLVGSDTIITWEGISPDEKVILEYSIDNGKNWKLICDTASGLKYIWNNISKPVSNECLVRVKHIVHSLYPKIEWEKSIGGSNDDYIHSIEETYEGGYIAAGQTNSFDGDVLGQHGNIDGWLVKLNNSGSIEWQKCLGGSLNDVLYSVKQTSDGGYITAGYTVSSDGDVSGNHGNYDMWVVKLDVIGEIEWQQCFGSSNFERAASIVQTNDGGYIVAGYSTDVLHNVYLVKLNSSGNIDWEQYIYGSNFEYAYDIRQTLDGGFIIAGETRLRSLGNTVKPSDYFVIKINSSGVTEWEKNYGGAGNDVAYSIQETLDSGFIVTGITYSDDSDGDVSDNHGLSDIWTVKLDPSGEIEWQKCLGGSDYDYSNAIIINDDNNYIIAGYTKSNDDDVDFNHGYHDYWILKLDNSGSLIWQQCFGGAYDDLAQSIKQTYDGGYIIAGDTYSSDWDVSENHGKWDIWIVKLSAEGTSLQEDVSDSVFAIVAPEVASIDVDMGKVLTGKTRDSIITNFITNIGSWECRIDSIYFRGADSAAFSLVSGIPQYTVATGSSHFAEFGFRPTKVGLHEAEIVIISQSDTLIQNIRGEGIEPKLVVMCDIIDFGQVCLKEYRDTVKAVIKNTGTASIEITKTEITGPDIDQFEIIDGGGSFILNPGDERELTLRFEPEYLGKTSTNLNFYHKEAGSPALTQLYGEGIKQEIDCDSSGFEYPNFTGVDDIILAGNTGRVDDYIRLTYAKQSVIGGIWHEKPVLVGNGFITEFSFRMSSGNNVNTDDGSLPGADGLAFVIQNNENIDMGLYGGGIGYHGIEKAIAVEFDLFMNNSKQIIDFKDPNGNHVAIQKKYGDKLSALHNSNNTIEINEDIPELKTDGTIYYVKIEYNIEPNVMAVYLDETGELDDPVIVAGGIELNDIVGLEEDLKAFVGITSATGNAYQIHDLLDWYFCPFPVDITAVESEIPGDDITFNIYPNPASESTTIEINNPEYQFISLSITDIFGREVKSLFSGYKTAGNFTFNWETGGMTDGVYFCRLNLGDVNIVKAIMVNK